MPEIITLPHPLLRQEAEKVENIDAITMGYIQDLECAMTAGKGTVGIAAPQISVMKCIAIVDCSLAQRPCQHHGRLVMINPVLTKMQGEVMGREGCLSVPEWVATVPRARMVIVQYLDINGVHCELAVSGFEARVIQHEIDHLNGILFIDHVLRTKDMVRRLRKS